MPGVIFWDVDTQYDFIMPDGKLYVTASEKRLPNLKKLTDHARQRDIPIYGSVDNHQIDDPEISDNPDFLETFPPHCIAGTEGQKKVPETQPQNPLWIDPDAPGDLISRIQKHSGEIIFRKQRFDVFTNPNVEPVLNAIKPDRIVLYGVALDVCNAYAINGFLNRNTAPIQLVLDAAQAINPERGDRLVDEWQQQGVEIVSTDQIINA
ncbi:MAG: cysteine hydrolase [Gemmatimonadetes bacterium]|nr:cysteine hydrolase [Gemmatimonadota bacterium]MYF75731.1 cysteine hydrolase [Gemmatimonadota bacterium]MYK50333.1 cysteine hydrolase [Gemmatimonadota bacterium]